MDRRDFEKLIKQAGWRSVQLKASSHFKVVDASGKTLFTYAVRHSKGSKEQVLKTYVKDLQAALKEYQGE